MFSVLINMQNDFNVKFVTTLSSMIMLVRAPDGIFCEELTYNYSKQRLNGIVNYFLNYFNSNPVVHHF